MVTVMAIMMVMLILLWTKNKKLKKENKELWEHAVRDSLTGLYNKRFQQLSVNSFLRTAVDSNVLSVMMVDIDHFKNINDTHGHQAGNQILKMVADILRSNISRSSDATFRYGGEEFLIILPGANLVFAKKIAEKIRLEVEAAKNNHQRVTISLGVFTVTELKGIKVIERDGKVMEAAIQKADKLLYQAKEAGRNQVVALEMNFKEIDI